MLIFGGLTVAIFKVNFTLFDIFLYIGFKVTN